jgi:hypothetical protein
MFYYLAQTQLPQSTSDLTTLIGKVLGVIVICLFLYGVGLVLSGIAQLRQGHAEWKMPIIQGGLYMAGTSVACYSISPSSTPHLAQSFDGCLCGRYAIHTRARRRGLDF